MTAVILASGELAIQKALIHGRHLRSAIVFAVAAPCCSRPFAPSNAKTGLASTVAMKLPRWSPFGVAFLVRR